MVYNFVMIIDKSSNMHTNPAIENLSYIHFVYWLHEILNKCNKFNINIIQFH